MSPIHRNCPEGPEFFKSKKAIIFLELPFQINRGGINSPPYDRQNQNETIDHFHCRWRFSGLLHSCPSVVERQHLGQIRGLL